MSVMGGGASNLNVVSSSEAQHGRSVNLSLRAGVFVTANTCIQVLVWKFSIFSGVCAIAGSTPELAG